MIAREVRQDFEPRLIKDGGRDQVARSQRSLDELGRFLADPHDPAQRREHKIEENKKLTRRRRLHRDGQVRNRNVGRYRHGCGLARIDRLKKRDRRALAVSFHLEIVCGESLN